MVRSRSSGSWEVAGDEAEVRMVERLLHGDAFLWVKFEKPADEVQESRVVLVVRAGVVYRLLQTRRGKGKSVNAALSLAKEQLTESLRILLTYFLLFLFVLALGKSRRPSLKSSALYVSAFLRKSSGITPSTASIIARCLHGREMKVSACYEHECARIDSL